MHTQHNQTTTTNISQTKTNTKPETKEQKHTCTQIPKAKTKANQTEYTQKQQQGNQ